MQKGVFLVFLLLTRLAYGTDHLALQLEVDKQEYAPGEPILMTYRLTNLSNTNLEVEVSRVSHWVIPYIALRGPRGELLESSRRPPHIIGLPQQKLVDLEPGEAYVQRHVLQKLYPDTMQDPHYAPVSPGNYSITGRYEFAPKQASGSTRSGQLFSEPTVFTIRHWTNDELAAHVHALRYGTDDEQLEALHCLRIGADFTTYRRAAIDALEFNIPRRVRELAAYIIYLNMDPEMEDLCLAYLEDGNVKVSLLMARCLAQTQSTRAVPALLELADPDKNPQHYKKFVRPLFEIDRQRALPILQKILQAEEDPLWRQWAAERYRETEVSVSRSTQGAQQAALPTPAEQVMDHQALTNWGAVVAAGLLLAVAGVVVRWLVLKRNR